MLPVHLAQALPREPALRTQGCPFCQLLKPSVAWLTTLPLLSPCPRARGPRFCSLGSQWQVGALRMSLADRPGAGTSVFSG